MYLKKKKEDFIIKETVEVINVSVTEVIKNIIKEKNISQVELAEKIHITKQNLSNKMNRDNFSSLELVEIADALDMSLILKDTTNNKEYIIDYPAENKGKPKRINKTI